VNVFDTLLHKYPLPLKEVAWLTSDFIGVCQGDEKRVGAE
jgi:hypothetical protein